MGFIVPGSSPFESSSLGSIFVQRAISQCKLHDQGGFSITFIYLYCNVTEFFISNCSVLLLYTDQAMSYRLNTIPHPTYTPKYPPVHDLRQRPLLSDLTSTTHTVLFNGCASVLKTYSSKLIKFGSANIRSKYFKVSAIQKLSMRSCCFMLIAVMSSIPA